MYVNYLSKVVKNNPTKYKILWHLLDLHFFKKNLAFGITNFEFNEYGLNKSNIFWGMLIMK